MQKFSEIKARAAARKGGEAALQELMTEVTPLDELAQKSDDRCLAMMTKCIHQAGFSWQVIEKKWPQFEEAYFGFDIARLNMLPPEDWDAYLADKRVVRNGQKIKAVRENAAFVAEVSDDHGGFAKFMADWPADDQIGLMDYLKKHGARLGGNTGQYFLRRIGWDAFVIGGDTVLALKEAGLVIADQPSSKRDLKAIQAAFNTWQEESGLPYAHLSRICAFSVGENYDPAQIKAQMTGMQQADA